MGVDEHPEEDKDLKNLMFFEPFGPLSFAMFLDCSDGCPGGIFIGLSKWHWVGLVAVDGRRGAGRYIYIYMCWPGDLGASKSIVQPWFVAVSLFYVSSAIFWGLSKYSRVCYVVCFCIVCCIVVVPADAEASFMTRNGSWIRNSIIPDILSIFIFRPWFDFQDHDAVACVAGLVTAGPVEFFRNRHDTLTVQCFLLVATLEVRVSTRQ